MQVLSRNLPIFPAVKQEHALGCGVACVASRCGISYKEALTLFVRPENAWVRGFYCREIVDALARAGLRYSFSEFDPLRDAGLLEKPGTIVFYPPSKEFPVGHYVIRARAGYSGWMNPWSNFPQMIPIESGFQEAISGHPAYVVFEEASKNLSARIKSF
jgi:hypothetical protein